MVLSEQVWLAMTFVLSAWVQAARCKAFISKEQEIQMSMDIRNLVANSFDEDGLRFLVPGIIRLCFHDCVIICDGCIDTRRKVQGGNNGTSFSIFMSFESKTICLIYCLIELLS